MWVVDGTLTNTLFPSVPEKSAEKPYPKALWRVENGQITTDIFPEIPEKSAEKPYPKALWRIDPTMNGGLPYHDLLPLVSGINMWSLPAERKIKVYSMWEKQGKFDHNGLAVLDPISCSSHQEMNGRWDVTLVHPLDDWGKWRWLVPQNILKVNSQLFRISMEQPKINTSEKTVTVTAEHIFYDLNRDILLLKKLENAIYPAYLLQWIMNSGTFYPYRNTAEYEQWNIYSFDYATDMQELDYVEVGEYANVTLTGALIGESNSFISVFGGELYRNNFYFSINKRMENSRDNAFFLRYSADLLEIEMTADFSNFATGVHYIDMDGEWGGASWWTDETIKIFDVASTPFIRATKFSVPLTDQIKDKYFYANAYPKYTYKINVANIKKDPRYADFANLQDLKVGDKGTIYCEPLGIQTEQMITVVERDEITMEYKSVTLGSVSDILTRPNQYAGVTTSGNSATDKQVQALQESLSDIQTLSDDELTEMWED